MAFSPGKNVGNVSIRVVPDTTKFRMDLRRKLATIEKTTSMTVRVDRADVDRTKFRESIRRQLAELNDLDIATQVEVTIDKAKIRRGALRRSIQEQFDQLKDVRVYIKPEIRKYDQEKFREQVRHMVNKAEQNVNVGVAVHSAAASAQMRYVTRPRWVDIFIRVNKASISKALTTLAALSGARLSWQWIDDLYQRVRNLDKSLPTILNWTSGITALIAALSGSVSGLVGIGQGLFTITPALLVLPGLFLNALGSVTALIVALKNSKTELAALSGDMQEIGKTINTEFWDRARQPIVDLVKGLMPQLLNSFKQLSAGIGDFTAALAQAFGQELAGGRLESIFAGIAEGWRVLGTGASGFAGALVNLSEIAAKYTPRLAGWFVRQANTFDNFLTSIATDGRLDAWMEQAIDSMYDLWDATRGVAGVFAGIWKAADQAGSGGLKGFAQMMLEWRKVVNGADFQRGLSAIFRGSYVAMDAFGNAIKSLGRLVADMPGQFERFVGSVGGFLGGVFDAAFKALNNVNVAIGLDGFSSGLDAALRGITPALQPIADTFGRFLGLLGELAGTLLPTAAGVLADLMPAIDAVIEGVKDVLPDLTGDIAKIGDILAPAIESFVKAVTPSLRTALRSLAGALENIAPTLADLVEALGPTFAAAVDTLAGAVGGIADIRENNIKAFGTNPIDLGLEFIADPSIFLDLDRIHAKIREIQASGGILGGILDGAVGLNTFLRELPGKIGVLIANLGPLSAAIAGAIGQALAGIPAQLSNIGVVVGTWLGTLPGVLSSYVGSVYSWFVQTGATLVTNLVLGLQSALGTVILWIAMLPARISAAFGNAGSWLIQAGRSIIGGLLTGLMSAFERVKSFIAGVGPWIVNNKGPIAYDRRMLMPAGQAIMSGLNDGLSSGFVDVKRNIGRITQGISLGFGADGQTGLAGIGNQINITQPLLPGETPKEQRDNLVGVLQWI